MNGIELKRPLVQRVMDLRKNTFSYDSLNLPQSVDFDVVPSSEGCKTRCRVVLTAHGCKQATCTMCPLPDESVPGRVPVTTAHWLAQIQHALSQHDAIDILTLYHNGNFFSDAEVSAERREAIYAALRASSVSTLVVESLPQFITPAKVARAAELLGPGIKLEVAIGLQSVDDFLRETAMASPCTLKGFDQAWHALHAQGYSAQVFLMHQVPFLTPEESSVALLDSVKTLHDQYGLMDPILCPMRIAKATVVEELATLGLFEHGSLWHLVDVLVRIRQDFPGTRARVAISLLREGSAADGRRTRACPACQKPLFDWITAFNSQRAAEPPARCACAPAPLDFDARYDPAQVQSRIEAYLARSNAIHGAKASCGSA